MRVLITGSSGRVGRAIAQEIATVHDVVGLDLVPAPHTNIIGSITDAALVARAVRGVDAIIHTAALHAPHVGNYSADQFKTVNVRATESLLDAAIGGGVKRFVFTSTTSIYGDAMVNPSRAVWVTEALTPVARDIYDETKLAAETACATAARAGLPCISLRMSRCFPEPENLLAIYRLYRGVDARDAANAHRLALESSLAGFEAFNISAATPFGESDMVDLKRDAAAVIRRLYPWVDDEFARRGWALPVTIDRVYVVEKAQRMLGYQPQYGFESLFPRRTNGLA